jgi:hypothetical protein
MRRRRFKLSRRSGDAMPDRATNCRQVEARDQMSESSERVLPQRGLQR